MMIIERHDIDFPLDLVLKSSSTLIYPDAFEEEDKVDMEEHSSQDDKGSNMGDMTRDESNMEGEDKS